MVWAGAPQGWALMIQVTFKGLRERLQTLDRLEREQLPFAAALALTTTAQDVKAALVEEMASVFDRPTRATLGGIFIQPATKEKMEARVWVNDGGVSDWKVAQARATNTAVSNWEQDRHALKWLAPQIYGGPRDYKASETRLADKGLLPAGKYITPARGLKLDAYGNISRGTMNKIVSGLGAQFDKYANSTTSRRSAGNLKRYFVLKKGSRPLGIAERTGKGKAGMRMVVAFASRPQYSKRFDFFEVAERVADDRLPIRFELALARALGTRRV
jgi:hypothetical protein